MQQAGGSVWCGTDKKQIGLAVAVVVEEAGARACAYAERLRCELHGNRRGRFRHTVLRIFRERKSALIAVASAEGSAGFRRGHFLKFLQMVFGVFGVTF